MLKQIEDLKNQTKSFEMILGDMDTKAMEALKNMRADEEKETNSKEEKKIDSQIDSSKNAKTMVIDLDNEKQIPKVAKEEETKKVNLDSMTDE